MPIVDVSDAGVYVSANGTSGWARIQDITSYDATHGSEDDSRTRVFGKADPYVRTGSNTDEYSMDGLYNPEDTGGQNVLRTSRDNRTSTFLAVVTDDTPGAEVGYIQEIKVTEYSESAEADGDYVECSFTAVAVGARAAIGAGGLVMTP